MAGETKTETHQQVCTLYHGCQMQAQVQNKNQKTKLEYAVTCGGGRQRHQNWVGWVIWNCKTKSKGRMDLSHSQAGRQLAYTITNQVNIFSSASLSTPANLL